MQPTAGHRSLPISERGVSKGRIVSNKGLKEKALKRAEVMGPKCSMSQTCGFLAGSCGGMLASEEVQILPKRSKNVQVSVT